MPDIAVAPVRPAVLPGASADLPAHRHPTLCTKPELSVVLGSLNRLDLLKLAIDSVRAEMTGIEGEIVVIDGGSTDGSMAWLVAQEDIVTVIQRNRFEKDGEYYRRRSWGAFMNIGFRAASASYVLMISDDCMLLPGAIKAARERIASAEQSGIKVGGCAFYFRNWPVEGRYYVQRTIGGNLMVNHGIYSKEALVSVGFANEDDYVFYKADTDLSLKIWAAGYAIIDSPDSICEHYFGEGEELRATNNAVLDYDRDRMRLLWPKLASKENVARMGKIYSDLLPTKQAELAWAAIREKEVGQRGVRR